MVADEAYSVRAESSRLVSCSSLETIAEAGPQVTTHKLLITRILLAAATQLLAKTQLDILAFVPDDIGVSLTLIPGPSRSPLAWKCAPPAVLHGTLSAVHPRHHHAIHGHGSDDYINTVIKF